MSKSGAAFKTEGSLREGQELNLRLFLKKKMVEIKAVVVHVRDIAEERSRVGAKFMSSSDDVTALLENELREIAERYKLLETAEGPGSFRSRGRERPEKKIF
jgi:hypothetical protein